MRSTNARRSASSSAAAAAFAAAFGTSPSTFGGFPRPRWLLPLGGLVRALAGAPAFAFAAGGDAGAIG
eukprot:12005566-Alexandrium_andersonii.AAC.1